MLSDQTRFDVVNVQTLRSTFGPSVFVDGRDVDRMTSSGLLRWTLPALPAASVSDANGWELQKAIKEKVLTELRSAWRKHIRTLTAPVDFEHIGETFDGVFNLVETAGPQELDMSGFDPQTTNGEHLVAALRAAYRWKDEVVGWSAARDVARLALERSKKVDVELCLAGLD